MGFDDFDDIEVGLENTGNKTQDVIDDFDDVEVELENVQSDVKQTISVGEQLGVTFNKVSDIIKGTTEDFDEFEESAEDACETAANGLEKVTDAAAGTSNAASKMKDDFEGIEEAIRNMPPEELEEITGATQDASVAVAEYNDNLKETVKLQNEVKETKTDFTQFDFSDLSAELKDTKENYDSLQKSVIDFSKIDFSSLTETAKRVSDVDYSQIDFSHMTEEYKEAKELFSETDEFEDFLNNLSTGELKELADNIDTINGKKAALNDDFDDVEVEIENVSDGIKDVNSNLKETVKLEEQLEGSRPFSIEDGFEDTDAEIENASKGVEEIKDSVAAVSDVFDDVDTGAAGVSSEVENISTGIEDLNNDLKETVKLKDQLEESSSFSIDNSFDDATEDDIKKANERYAERKAKEAKAAEDAATAAASKKFPEILDRINNAKSESSNRDEFQAKFEESARPLINEFGKYLSGDQNATLQKAYQDAAQSTLEKEIAKAEKNKEVLEELRAAQKEEEEIAKRLEAHRFEDSLILNTKYLGNSLAEEPKTKPEAKKRNNEIAEYYNALKKLTEDPRFESFKDQGSYLNALVALEKAAPIAEKTNRLNAYLDQLKGLNEQIKSGDPKAAELKDSWSKLTEAFDNLDEVTKEKLKYGLKSVTNKINVIAKEELRTTINDQKSTLVGNAMTETPEDRYKALNDAKAAIDAESKKLKESGLLSESEIKGQTSSFLTKLEEQLSITVGRIIKSTFSGNLEEAAKAIEALGDKDKVDKLDVSDTVKDILTSAKPGSKIAGLIKKIYTEQTIDALKAEATVKEGDFNRSGSRQDAELALEAYNKVYAAMESAPEGVVSETDKVRVQNKMKDLEDTIEDLYHAVTDEIDELTKDVSKTISNIKQDRTLSTKEKIDAVQGQLGRLEDATPVSTGDVKALEDSKDATQRALNNLQAQYADEQTRAAKQATQQVLSSVKSIVSGIERAMNTVVSIIRRGLSLLNRAINFTVNSLKSVITGAQKIIQLVGSLSNRVRSFVGNLLNANKAGERSNVIVRSVGLTFTELNSAISLVERAFNALFNNKMLERAMKFDSTIASITMLLGDEATADVRDFADALETGFGVPATKTISDLQEISSLLKGVGIQTEYIANASEDLYSMANYMAALGMAGGDVSEVMTKLQSGLKGMTQSIDDLGLSVRETQMDEFLRNNGYNVKFSGLSEANREIVRLAAIISQFRKSFNISDYPKLMKNTYFQISLVKTQIEEIGTLIGKIFEGLLKNILPFVMKAVYTIKSAVIGIGESLGIDMGFGETESQASEASAAVDEITESTKEATKAAKEYSGAAGFDKLESLSSGSSSGSGSGDADMSSLLANVGNISDELIKIARDSDGFIDVVDKEIRKKLKKLKKDIQEYADDLLGHHVDLSFGFDKDSAKASLDGIWENIKRWWESVSETGLWLGFRFAEDIQIGRLSNDLLSIIESITKIVAVIQEALEPVIKKLYDKYLSPIVKDIGDGIHNFADGLAGLADVIEAMFSGDKSLADVKKMIDDLAETHPKFAALADDILTIKENWKGFIDIWNGKDTKKAKKLEEAFPVITQLEKTIKSITELTGTLWKDYLKPLFRHIKKNMPTPEQLLKNLQDAVDKINEVLGKDSTKITITDAASSVLQIITNKAKALKKVLKSIGKVAISLITPTDENGNVASKEDGGSSVLSLLADSMSNFVDNEFTEWLDEVTDDLTKFIQENKEDIVKVIDDLRDFAWDAFKTVIEKIIKLFKWVVAHEEDVRKVLNTINRAFKFVVNNAEGLISVFVALKGLKKIASGATAIVSVLDAIKKLKGLGSVEEAAGEAASVISASTIKIAGEVTILAATAVLGYELGKEIGKDLDIGERLADLKTKNDDKAMTALLASLYAESTTGTIESMKEAQDQLMRDFKLTVEDLKPFEYKDKYGIPQLDMSRLSVDGAGIVRTVASNGSVVLAKGYEDVEAGLAKLAQKQEAEEKKVKDREKRNSRTSAQKIADGVNGVPSSISEMSKDIVDAIKTAGKESRKKSLTALEAIRDGIGGIPSDVKDTVKELKGINTILGSALNPDTGGKATATEEEKKGKAAIKAREDKEKTKRKEARALLKSPKTTEAISENPKLILKYLDAFKVEKQKKIKEAVNAYTLSIKNAKDSREVDSAFKTFKASLHELKIPGFKRGGSIGKGSLFIANENGSATELIGNITKRSGTDVANNKMITDAMEVAVYNGFAEAFNQMQTNNVNSNQTQTINISGFGMIDKTTLKKLAQLLAPYLDATNKSLITT